MILCYSLPNGQNEKVRSALFFAPKRSWTAVESSHLQVWFGRQNLHIVWRTNFFCF